MRRVGVFKKWIKELNRIVSSKTRKPLLNSTRKEKKSMLTWDKVQTIVFGRGPTGSCIKHN